MKSRVRGHRHRLPSVENLPVYDSEELRTAILLSPLVEIGKPLKQFFADNHYNSKLWIKELKEVDTSAYLQAVEDKKSKKALKKAATLQRQADRKAEALQRKMARQLQKKSVLPRATKDPERQEAVLGGGITVASSPATVLAEGNLQKLSKAPAGAQRASTRASGDNGRNATPAAHVPVPAGSRRGVNK